MKQSLLNLSLIFTLIIVFSSCGSISITQKRYSNGLNIDWFAAKDKKENNPNQTPKRKAKTTPSNSAIQNTEVSEVGFSTEYQITENSVNDNQTTENKTFDTHSPEITIKDRVIKSSNELNKKVNEEDLTINKASKTNVLKSIKALKKAKKLPNKTNDTPFIILFILAIIPVLTLLAIYLYYGEINFHFWLNLILLLIGGGIYASIGFLGISFAVIHALLVIFGVF